MAVLKPVGLTVGVDARASVRDEPVIPHPDERLGDVVPQYIHVHYVTVPGEKAWRRFVTVGGPQAAGALPLLTLHWNDATLSGAPGWVRGFVSQFVPPAYLLTEKDAWVF